MAVNYPRYHNIAGSGRFFASMQDIACELGVFGFKAHTVAPNISQFYVYLYSVNNEELLSITQTNILGQLRTGATSAVSALHMSREDPRS